MKEGERHRVGFGVSAEGRMEACSPSLGKIVKQYGGHAKHD